MSVEYYTPPYVMDVVRRFFGGQIDLDVASCAEANKIVQAEEYFAEGDDTLNMAWIAHSVWMNHPYGRGQNTFWIDKLIGEVTLGHISEALCLTNVATSTKYCQRLLEYPTVFFNHRIKFIAYGEKQQSPRYDNMITYLGPQYRHEMFEAYFDKFGVVKL